MQRFVLCLGAQIYIQFVVWDQTVIITSTLSQGCCRTPNKPRHLKQPHCLFGLFAAGQHKHPTHSGWGTSSRTQTHLLTLTAPILSDEWGDPRYRDINNKKWKNSTNNNLKANQPKQSNRGDSTGVFGQRSARGDCLHFRSRTSSSKDVERANALARVGLSARSTTFSGSASEQDEQWTSRSASMDSEANLLCTDIYESSSNNSILSGSSIYDNTAVTCHCLLMLVLVLWALHLCSSCSSSSVWLSHCLISHSVPPLSLLLVWGNRKWT